MFGAFAREAASGSGHLAACVVVVVDHVVDAKRLMAKFGSDWPLRLFRHCNMLYGKVFNLYQAMYSEEKRKERL